MGESPRRGRAGRPAQGFRFGSAPRLRLWTRLILPVAGLIIIIGWFGFPHVRFALLRRQYESSEGRDRKAALNRILRLRTPLAIPLLLDEFRGWEMREEHLDDLLDLLTERDLDLLLERLRQGEREDRSVAAFTIAALIDRPWVMESEEVLGSLPEVYGALIDGLSGGPVAQDYMHMIESAIDAVPASDVVTPLIERFRSTDGQDRRNAIRASYYLRKRSFISESPEIQGLIRDALHSEDPKMRISAATVLEDQAGPGDVETLLQLIDDPDWLVRRSTCRALGGLGGEGVADALLTRLSDEEEGVRRAAVIALGRLRVERIVPDLIRMLRETPTMRVRRGGVVVKVPNPFPAEAAAGVLAKFPTDEVMEALGGVIRDPDAHEIVRLQAIRSLGAMRRTRALVPLAALLDDPHWPVRLEAVRAIQTIGGRDAVHPLVDRLKKVVRSDPSPGEVKALGDALREITGKDHGPYPGDGRFDSEKGIESWEAWLRGE